MAQPVIEVDRFSKSFRSGLRRTPFFAVQDLSFSVQQGSVVGFLGPNGAGKTTTIGALLGLLRVTSGQIKIFGEHPSLECIRARVGYVAEVHPVYATLSAREQLLYLGRLSKIPEPELFGRIDELLTLVELSDTKKKVARKFSKGMAQRLGLAQALLHRPDLLILDEPTTGLDPEGRTLFLEIIRKQQARGTTIFFSTHILNDVEAVGDRIIVIKQGKLIEDVIINQDKPGEERPWQVELRGEPATLAAIGKIFSLDLTVDAGGLAVATVPAAHKAAFVSSAVTHGAEIVSISQSRPSLEKHYLSLMESR